MYDWDLSCANILEAVVDALVILDEGLRIHAFNTGAERLFGYTTEEVTGQPITRLLPEPAEGALQRAVNTLDVVRGPRRSERRSWIGRRKNGSFFAVDAILVPFPQQRRTALALRIRRAQDSDTAAMQQDDVERRIERARRQENLTTLVAGLAPEYNNRHAIIFGNLSLLKTEIPPESPLRDSLSQIEHATRRAMALTQQLLNYASRDRSAWETIDLNTLIRDHAMLFEALVHHNVTFEYHLDRFLPLVLANATQIRQLLVNLIINATESIGNQDGTIILTTVARRLQESDLARYHFETDLYPGSYAMLEICDTGSGMDAATLARCCDPFFTTRNSGRGMGLSEVLGFVHGHRGALNITSAPGDGTTVSILLPAGPVTLVRRTMAQTNQKQLERGLVLVVDDEAGMRRLMKRMLEQLGFEVVTATDGRTGSEMFGSYAKRVSCAIIDLMIPEGGGERVVQAIRRITPDLPIIVMSGHPPEVVADHFMGEQLAGVLSKPFTRDDLTVMLQRALALTG